jgi:hypothetical protein
MRSGFKLALLATVCSIALTVSTSSAMANTYCVGTDACPGGTAEPTIQVAFDTAGTHVGADTVLIGPLGSPYNGPFIYNYPSETVSVIGVGADKPVIQGMGGGPFVMRVNSTGAALVQNLSIIVPNALSATGLSWTGTAQDLLVSHTGTGVDIRALFPVGDATLQDSLIKLGGGGWGTAIELQLASAFTMRDSTLEGTTRVGVDAPAAGSSVILQRVSLTASSTALQMSGAGTNVTAQQLVARSVGAAFSDAVIEVLSGSDFDANHATIYSNGTGRGVHVWGSSANAVAQVTSSVVSNVFVSGASQGTGAFNGVLNFSYSLVSTSPSTFAGGFSSMGPGAVVGAVDFVDAAGGDFRLKAPQAAIDVGNPADTTTLDRGGKPRIVDGDGVGGAMTDVGAFEYQRVAPVAVASVSAPALQGAAIDFSGGGSSDADAGDTLSYAWDFGDGSVGSGVGASHVYATDGLKTVSLTVTDQLGLSSTAVAQVAVIDASAPAFTIGKPKLNKKRTTLSYKLGCPATETSCTIDVAMSSSRRETSGGAGGKKKVRVLAKSVRVVLAGGKSGTATLRFNKTARALIARKKKLKTKVTFVGTDAAGNTGNVVQAYTAKQGKAGSAINKK